MTSEERASALRDIVYETIDERGVVITKDLVIEKQFHTDREGIGHKMYRARERYRLDAHVWLAKTYDICETVHLARQKLAAEREAKKSPREKRLETSLKRMLEATAHLSVNRLQVYLEALDALSEES